MIDPANDNTGATSKPCALCGKPMQPAYRPFCSKRCADVDLNRWLTGSYVVPTDETEEEDEARKQEDS